MTSNTKTITRTAIAVALVVTSQFIGKMIPAGAVLIGPVNVGQIITGSLVNLMLVISCLIIGTGAGAVVGILSALLATLIGIGPIFPIITPAIAISNVILVVIVGVIMPKVGKCRVRKFAVVVVAAIAKCGFLWYTVPRLFALIPEIKPPQAKMLTIMFSWPQFITALIGGAIAILVYPTVKKAIEQK